MAQSVFKVNLSKSSPVLLTEDQTRTVISASSLEGGRENLPGIAYMHNVLPTATGLKSVGYEKIVDANDNPDFLADGRKMLGIWEIYDEDRDRMYFGMDDAGECYIFWLGSVYDWQYVEVGPLNVFHGITDFTMDKMSSGRVNGITYVYYPLSQQWVSPEEATASYFSKNASPSNQPEFIPAPLIGTSYEDTIGITASSGYLIAYTKFSVSWSSTIDPTDFTPSETTGTGGADIAGLAGNIVTCTPVPNGFLVFTEGNIVSATYTGNVRYPFKFAVVPGSQGLASRGHVTYDANDTAPYVYTEGGLQAVKTTSADVVLPEISDFLAGRQIETLDTETWEFNINTISIIKVMRKLLNFFNSRYLYISYGEDELTHIVVYDSKLQKLGKLLIDHVDVFEFIPLDDYPHTQLDSPIAVMQADGSCYRITKNVRNIPSGYGDQGVVVLGKLQGSRTRLMTLLSVEVEGRLDDNQSVVEPFPEPQCIDLSSLTGAKDFEVTGGTLVLGSPSESYTKYYFRKSAINHSIAILGRFNLNTVLITYTANGRR